LTPTFLSAKTIGKIPKCLSIVYCICSLWIGDVGIDEVKQITNNPECDREYNPRWSPDGSKFVYWRDPYANGKPTGTAIFTINVDGSDEHRLTNPEDFCGEVDWSPGGKWIIFTAVTPSSRSLWVIPAKGGEPVVIAQGGIFTMARGSLRP
jgi:Tol biopolymer transport system component